VKITRTAGAVREAVAALRLRGEVAFVPTMGALHGGHGSLVARARASGPTALSIFVNPLQFGAGEDFEGYPRDPERDAALAREWGVDVLFAPDAAELLPAAAQVSVDPGPLGDRLEGRSRPGHFRGVLTIVAKLFHLVAPDVAIFGQKDLQQATLVRAMVRDLDFPLRVEVAPTVREPDGLALSSRNAFLSPQERTRATALWASLVAGERAIQAGERRTSAVRDAMLEVLLRAGVEPDYAAVLRREDLAEADELRGPLALAVAARVGRTRLIDNLLVDAGRGAD
jgi:pantoate--beta-alanine ligase